MNYYELNFTTQLTICRTIRPASSCSSWDYSGGTSGGGSGSNSSGVSSVGDRGSVADTSAASTSSSSRRSSTSGTGRMMLRSTTLDEDDGWSTDFSISDEDVGESYLDHVEVSSQLSCIVAGFLRYLERLFVF